MDTTNTAPQPRGTAEAPTNILKPHMTGWAAAYLATVGSVFGYWKNSIAAGAFVFLLSVFATLVIYNVATFMVYWLDRLERATLGLRLEMINLDTSLLKVANLFFRSLDKCSGNNDCSCWWHEEQRTRAEKMQGRP